MEAASNAVKDAGLQREDAVEHFRDKLPFVIAIVELDESPHLTTNIIGSGHDQLECDLAVMVTWEGVTGESSLPQFKLLDRRDE